MMLEAAAKNTEQKTKNTEGKQGAKNYFANFTHVKDFSP
jgi:hypothetical protein